MINCIIADDEPLAQQVLESHILQTGELRLVKKCANAAEAFEALGNTKIGLVFLDIKMPGMNGLDFIRSLRTPPAVIFTTAFSEYAVTSYELEAVDYLMKPVTFERFCLAMARFRKIGGQPVPGKPYSYFKIDGRLTRLDHAGLLYARSMKDYIILTTLRGNHIVHMTMKGLTELLPASGFIRVHRSYMIGISHIHSIGKNTILLGGRQIPVGENYRQAVELLKGRMAGSP